MTFAIEAHASVNQEYDGRPYFVHLCLVYNQAIRFIELIPQHRRDDVLNAVWLHDTIEDCRLTYNDILKISNKVIAINKNDIAKILIGPEATARDISSFSGLKDALQRHPDKWAQTKQLFAQQQA